MFEKKPDVVIEIGSLMGGTTMYLAHLLDLIGHGEVISIDIKRPKDFPKHPRITEITGSSDSAAIIEQVKALCAGKTVMVLHDGDHSKEMVMKDMLNFGPLVTKGQYFIVCDGCADVFVPGVKPGKQYAGPLKAVDEYLKNHRDFVVDEKREKYLITDNPQGYLLKV